jgi:hypothetical protein
VPLDAGWTMLVAAPQGRRLGSAISDRLEDGLVGHTSFHT